MRDDDERALVAALRVDEFFERRDRADVEMVRRFVEKEQIRFERECERQGGALLFPARTLAGSVSTSRSKRWSISSMRARSRQTARSSEMS